MSVLLVGLEEELTRTVGARLLAQDDEVRIVLGDEAKRETWRALGIRVAVGDLTDDDFLWRAFTNVRTVVAGERPPADAPDVRHQLAASMKKSDPDRLVVVGAGEDDPLVAGIRAADVDHVVLRFRKRGLLGYRSAASTPQLAAAIDAADDLAGNPRLDLDLSEERSWAELRLAPPG